MNIERKPVEELRPYPNNARTHSRKQISQIAKSIERFGFNNPVLIDDQNQIVAGHGRVQAAKRLGMKEVPTVRLSHLTPVEVRAYVLADNKLAELAGWDREILAAELQGLIDLDIEVELTGFEMSEVDIILDEAKQDQENVEDPVPPRSATPVSRPNDLWILGQHRLFCGDAREQKSYDALLLGEKATFVFTDPPYNVAIGGHVSGRGQVRHEEFAMGCGEMSSQQFTEFLQSTFRALAANSVPGSIHMTCMDWRHMREILDAGHAEYTELKNLCVWCKTNFGMGSFYRSQHELVFVWKSGTAPHVNHFGLGGHGRTRTNVWTYAGANAMHAGRMDDLSIHPTVKPVLLVADAIRDCSSRNDLVLDVFCGSGTILTAAERTGRRARALEIEPSYVDVSVRRWQSFTGKSAVLEATGQTFEQVEEQRAPRPAAA